MTKLIQIEARLELAATRTVGELQKKIALRTAYERLKSDLHKQTDSIYGTKAKIDKARKAFSDWKKAHIDYPTTKLDILENQLRIAKEKAEPALKDKRKAKEAINTDKRRTASYLSKQLRKLEMELKDSKAFNYSAEDVADLKKQISDIRKQLKPLR
jgi:chromosome segregation ATPase